MNAQTIMICSGKGGTGKSTVSVLLGAQLGAWSRRVLLIELDSGLRSVDMIAGVYGKTVYDIEDVLCGRCDGSKAIVPSPLYPGLSVISAPYEGGEVRAAPLAGLILAMREYFDYILLDTAAGCFDISLITVEDRYGQAYSYRAIVIYRRQPLGGPRTGCFNAGPGRPAGWAHCGGCPVTERPPRQRRAAGDEPCVPFQFWQGCCGV